MTKAIITGASRGLGAAMAQQLTATGVEVLNISRSSGTQTDLSDPAALTAWIARGDLATFLAEADHILLINNAGTIGPAALVGSGEATCTVAAVNLNITAPMLLTDAVLRLRPPTSTVRVAHISSGAGRRAYPGWAIYCATKAALDMHAQTLSVENHPGVRVASIAPGIVDTDMQADIRTSDGFPLQEQFIAFKETGQLVMPQEAARHVLRIISAPDFGKQVITDVRS